MEKDLADLRREYSHAELTEESVAADPFVQFSNWFEEYMNSGPVEPSAFTLSTVAANGSPSSRVVLLKGFDPNGFVFFTNYASKKSRDLIENPQVAMNFYWPELERQVQIRGRAKKTSRDESESYFGRRPQESQLGAWASRQSEELSRRGELEERLEEVRSRFAEKDVPCPPFWGGFRVTPESFEFWQGRLSRLHDRICYERSNNGWRIFRLYP